MRALTSWNPLGHPRPVTGLLYLFNTAFIFKIYPYINLMTNVQCMGEISANVWWDRLNGTVNVWNLLLDMKIILKFIDLVQ